MRIVVTGAAGRIGRVVCAELDGLGHDVVGVDLASAPGVTVVDVTDTRTLTPVLDGAHRVVHLAGYAGEGSLATALHSHVLATHSVLEAMRIAGVPRMAYGSSAHAVGFTPSDGVLGADARPRPDTFYAVGKVTGEALCSLYADRYSVGAACMRIGAYLERPTTRRHLSIWLSPADAVRMVEACLTAPDLSFAIVYGISANTRAWWDLEPGRTLGYHPQDDAEDFAAEILAEPRTERDEFDAHHVGGSFCAPYPYT